MQLRQMSDAVALGAGREANRIQKLRVCELQMRFELSGRVNDTSFLFVCLLGFFLISLLDSKLRVSCKLCFVLHMHSYDTHTSPFYILMCVCIYDHNICVYLYIHSMYVCVCIYIRVCIYIFTHTHRHTHTVMITYPEKCWSRPKSAGVFWGGKGALTMWPGTEPRVSPADSIAAISEERLYRNLAGPSRDHLPASVTALFRLSCFGMSTSGNSFHAS